MKPKKGTGNNVPAGPIHVPGSFESKDPRLQGAIQELRTTTRIENLQRVLKVLPLDDLKPADVHLVASLLTYLFLTIESKHPIRKTISRMLSTQFNSELVKISMGWNVNSFVVACIEDADAFERHNELVLGLQHCFSNFPLGIEAISDTINSVTVFMIDYFSKLVDRLNDKAKRSELHAYTNNVTKLLVAILQQCQLSDNLPDYCSKLMTSSYKVITDEYINFDTKSNCGVLMVISVIHVPEKIPDGVEYKTNPCLSLLKFDQCNDNEVTSAFNYKEFSKNYTANLCIYSGILNVVPQNLLCEEAIDGVPVISFMFGKLLDCAKRCTGKSTQILEVSRSLILISKVINTIPLGYIEPMFSQGLEYVWTHLDHYIDTVRQSARTIFENLIRLAHEHYKKGYQTLLKLILTNMIDLLVNRCTHYVALTILSNETGCSFLLDQFSHLPFILLINMQNSAVAPQICNTYESLMAQHKEEERNVDKWLELWVDLIKPLLTRARMPLVAYYQRLLVSAYKLQPMVLKSIMHYQWYSGSNELGALLGCLRTARQSGLDVPLRNVTVLSPEQISEKYWRGIIEYEFLELMMCHQSDEVRIHILGLIVESQKTREIFTLWELAFVKKFFHYNVTTQSPNTRQQFIALYKKVFVRIRDTLAVLNRNINNVTNKIELTADERKTILSDELELLQDQDIDNRQFVMVMFQKYLCPGFHMESNYQRRATCLELVLFIITERCVEETEIKNMWKPEYTTFLLQVLSDSYESNVRMSFSILKRLPYAVSEHFNKNTGLLFLRQTIQNASSLKPDKVTAAGYMLQLYLMTPYAKEMFVELYRQPPQEDLYTMAMNVFLNRANMATTMAKADLFRSVRDEAFYGDLMCVRNILENNDLSHCKQWTSLAYQIVATCRKIGEVVAPIVNNNSPEGYIPLEKFNARCYAVSAQMVLVYAWRSVKEVCLLLGELTLRAPDVDPANNEEVLTVDLMTSIEEYFVQVFRETKHRGAYEQASVGFVRFCKFLWSQSPTSPYSSWPRKWLDNIFSILRGEDQQVLQRLCPNRRSAGLPFMVVDIVITEPREANNEIFHYCMRSLLEIITNESSLSLSRIHAMNILKSLYRHHLLGEVVTTYVAEGVQAALRAFGSDKWGVRNSAFILIAALMQRIFGVQRSKELEINHKNKMSTKVFFMRYPELYQCFLNYLIDGTVHNKNVVVLHPVLLILERLYPCNTEEETQLGKYIKYVTKCLENPIYNIRELAAQASASLIPNLEVVDYIKRLLIKLWDVTLSDNYCQGTISQIICLLKSLNKGHSQLNVPDIIEGTFWIPISAGRFVSHFTVANYYDMLTLLTTVFIKNCQGSNIFLHLVKILTWQAVNENRSDRILSTARKKLTVARFNLHTHVVQNLYICDHYFKSLYMKELVLQAFGSAHEEVVEYCFNYVSYMYFDHPKYCQSSLYETEVVEVSEKERNVVRAMDLGLKEYMLESCHRSMRFFYLRVFYRLLTKSHDTIRSMLLAIQHYPCIMDGLKSSRQKVLDFFLHWCEGERVELYCAALNCLSNYLCSLGQDDAKLLNCSQLYRVLMCAASDASPSHLKMAVAQFLVANRRMYMEPEFFKHPDDITALWKMVLQLLDDDDQDVRNTMSELAPKIQNTRDTSQQMSLRFDSDLSIISDKAKDEILESCTLVLPPRISIPLFVSWILNTLNARPSKGQTNSQMKELFDPGVDNTFYEQKQFEKLTLYWFKRLLWKLDGGLSYDDGTIFVEEHVLMVATVMYNILYHHLPPSVNASARVTLLCVVKKVKEFAERSGINSDNFAGELQAVIAREFANLGMKGNNHPNIAKLQEIAMGIFSIE